MDNYPAGPPPPPQNVAPPPAQNYPSPPPQNYPPPPPQNVQQPHDQQAPPKERNTLGLIALVTSIVGFIFAVIPGALIVGWILLPVAFVLALVSLFQKGKGKGLGVAALIISIVGVIAGVIVFLAVVVDAVDEAFSDETTVTTQDDAAAADDAVDDADEADAEAEDVTADVDPAADEGTRANPYPIGTTVSADDWSVTVDEVVLDATDAVLAANEFNDPPEDGTQYLMVSIAATYEGDDPDGDFPWVSVDYVTSTGNTITSTDTFAVPPDSFDSLQTMYSGASTTGNVVLQVPSDTAGEGVLAVTPSMFGDKVFIAVQ